MDDAHEHSDRKPTRSGTDIDSYTARSPYRIEISGRAGARVLGPLADDFTVERSPGRTVLRGTVRDAAHLHGVIIRLTSMGAGIISVAAEGPMASGTSPRDEPGGGHEPRRDPGAPR